MIAVLSYMLKYTSGLTALMTARTSSQEAELTCAVPTM